VDPYGREVLDALFAFVGVFSPEGVVLDVNRAPLEASGLPREMVLGRRFIDLPWWAHSDIERARVADGVGRAARGETVRFDTMVERVRGGIMHVDACFAPIREDGKVVRVVGSGVDITVRKRAEQELARSEARLAEAQRVAHVGSWEWDVASNVVTWSDEMFRVYGLQRGRFDGTYQGFLSRVHPDDLEHTKNVITEALRNVTPFVYDHRILCGDGEPRMLHTRGEVVADADGRPVRMTGSCWDVTERWNAEREREHSLSLLKATLEATADGLLVVDRDGRVRAFNHRFLALWRIPQEMAGRGDDASLLAFVHDQLEDPDAFMARVRELYARPEADGLDTVHCRDGRVFERISRPQRLGREVVGRVWSFRDVTQRQRLLAVAEAARSDAEAAHAALVDILERVSDGFVALDRQWRYVYVNDCGGRMLGRKAADLVGKHIWTEFPEGRNQTFAAAYERAMTEQKPQQIRDYYPPWQRWFENRIYPSPDGISIFFSDITEQVRTEERLRASHAQLRVLSARLEAVRDEERRVMAREIHDQIGQALTGLKLEVAWLQRHAGDAGPDATRTRLQGMNDIIDGTLDTARRLSSALRPPMLDDLGLAAATEWQAQEFAARAGLGLELELPPAGTDRIPSVAGLTLFRILQEALTNVARHAAAHRVRVRLGFDGDDVVLEVTDDGRGITADEAARPDALGLLGMKERALVLGGTVSIEGKAGQGTTVTAHVPLRAEAA
jgi:PAS domain S-box-containing protein